MARDYQNALQTAAGFILYINRPDRYDFENIAGVTLRSGKTLMDAYIIKTNVLSSIGGNAQNELFFLALALDEVFMPVESTK